MESSLIRKKLWGGTVAGNIVLMLLLAVVVAGSAYSIATPTSTTTGTTAAYAQGQPDMASTSSPTDKDKALAVSIAIAQLQNVTSPLITFREDGVLNIIETGYSNGRNTLLNVQTESNISAANGYVFDNGIITAPNGTKIFP